MTPGQMATLTACVLVSLLTITWCVGTALRQLRERPTPIRELVEGLQIRMSAVEADSKNLRTLINRDNARVAKERQRERPPREEAPPEEPGEEQVIPPKDGPGFAPANGRQSSGEPDWERLCGPPPRF